MATPKDTMTTQEKTVPLHDLRAIASIVMRAAEADTVEEVLQRISDASRGLIGAKYAALGVPDGEGGLKHFKVSGIAHDDIVRIEHPPVGKGLLGVIMNERITLMMDADEMAHDHRRSGFPKGHPDMHTLLGMPVQAAGELFGMLYLSDRQDGQPFTMRDRWLLETLAGYAALAIAGTQLRENQRKLTIFEERERIGMALHDGVIQSLYAVGMQLELVRNGVMGADGVKPAIDGLNDIIEDIRDYIMDLKTAGQHECSVREHIERIITRMYIPQGLTISIDTPDTLPPLNEQAWDSLCMVMREALSNVVRHAGADYLTIRCEQSDNAYSLMVRDNGNGFNTDEIGRKQGLGLQNMLARVQHLNGTLSLESNPGEGTALLINVPLSNDKQNGHHSS